MRGGITAQSESKPGWSPKPGSKRRIDSKGCWLKLNEVGRRLGRLRGGEEWVGLGRRPIRSRILAGVLVGKASVTEHYVKGDAIERSPHEKASKRCRLGRPCDGLGFGERLHANNAPRALTSFGRGWRTSPMLLLLVWVFRHRKDLCYSNSIIFTDERHSSINARSK